VPQIRFQKSTNPQQTDYTFGRSSSHETSGRSHNEREYRDIIALVHDHEIGDSDDAETINGLYLAQLCSEDWGIYKTLSTNIGFILTALEEFKLDSEYESVARKHLEELSSRLENIPKTTGWRIRARIGEKKRWYELPEDDKKVIVSPSQLAERLQSEREKPVQ